MRGFRGSRLVAAVADMEPLVGNSYGNHIPDPANDNDVSSRVRSRIRRIHNNVPFYRSA